MGSPDCEYQRSLKCSLWGTDQESQKSSSATLSPIPNFVISSHPKPLGKFDHVAKCASAFLLAPELTLLTRSFYHQMKSRNIAKCFPLNKSFYIFYNTFPCSGRLPDPSKHMHHPHMQMRTYHPSPHPHTVHTHWAMPWASPSGAPVLVPTIASPF